MSKCPYMYTYTHSCTYLHTRHEAIHTEPLFLHTHMPTYIYTRTNVHECMSRNHACIRWRITPYLIIEQISVFFSWSSRELFSTCRVHTIARAHKLTHTGFFLHTNIQLYTHIETHSRTKLKGVYAEQKHCTLIKKNMKHFKYCVKVIS